MAMQKVRGSVEWIDDPGGSLRRYAARISFVAFFRYDRVVRMVFADNDDAGLLGGEIRR